MITSKEMKDHRTQYSAKYVIPSIMVTSLPNGSNLNEIGARLVGCWSKRERPQVTSSTPF
jgi:hypothetical protein